MVRLKVLWDSKGHLVSKVISIPYGAIKRYEGVCSTKSKSISIPYGAIKSDVAFGTFNKYNKISIPYGAIKR